MDKGRESSRVGTAHHWAGIALEFCVAKEQVEQREAEPNTIKFWDECRVHKTLVSSLLCHRDSDGAEKSGFFSSEGSLAPKQNPLP